MTHAGKVKCIYIDPPYNTGNKDFIYNDRFIDKDDAYKHSKWLEFMYRRLVVAKELLAEDGVFFVSIDDAEYAPLKLLLDRIFGEKNFLANLVWQTDGNFDNQARFKICHEYVLVYAVNETQVPSPPVIDPNAEESGKLFRDEIRNTIVKNGPKNPVSELTLPAGFPADFEEGIIPERQDKWPHFLGTAEIKNKKLISPVIIKSGWANKKLCERFIAGNFQPVFDTKNQLTTFILTQNGALENIKLRKTDQSHVVSVIKNVGSVQSAGAELLALQINFTYPKPVGLLEYLLSMIHGNDFLVVDFFAGSGTTAHAVMKLNQEDGGNRHFILVSSTEAVEEKISPNPPFAKGGTINESSFSKGGTEEEADDANNPSLGKRGIGNQETRDNVDEFAAFLPPLQKGGRGGFPDKNLCRDVCAERVRRVLQGYVNKKGEAVEGLGGDFAYFRAMRIPKGRVYEEIQDAQIWLALQLIHLETFQPFAADKPVQTAEFDHGLIAYCTKVNADTLMELEKLAADHAEVIVYAWQAALLRQHLPAANFIVEAIPAFLMNRFGDSHAT